MYFILLIFYVFYFASNNFTWGKICNCSLHYTPCTTFCQLFDQIAHLLPELGHELLGEQAFVVAERQAEIVVHGVDEQKELAVIAVSQEGGHGAVEFADFDRCALRLHQPTGVAQTYHDRHARRARAFDQIVERYRFVSLGLFGRLHCGQKRAHCGDLLVPLDTVVKRPRLRLGH